MSATIALAQEHDGHDKHGEHEQHEAHEQDEAHEQHDEHDENEDFGLRKAITEVREKGNRFKLSPEATQTLKLQASRVTSEKRNVFKVPSSSLVAFQDELGVYLSDSGWFEMSHVTLLRKGKEFAWVSSGELSQGQKIVNKGAALLRIAHLQATGNGGQGHAH